MKRLLIAFLLSSSAFATQRHVVASGGVTTGAATDSASGWTIVWAFSSSNTTLQAGDTVWIHAGTYSDDTTLVLDKDGSSGSPIKYRAHTCGIPKIQCTETVAGEPVINMAGDYVWLWGVEVLNTDVTSIADATNISASGLGTKVINCIVHDGGGNNLFSSVNATGTSGAEFYGNILYYAGRFEETNHAYNIYGQNQYGWKGYIDNILYSGWGNYGIHNYTEGSVIDSFKIIGNTIFNNSDTSNEYEEEMILMGGYVTATDNIIDSNVVFYAPISKWQGVGSITLIYASYGTGSLRHKVRDNWAYGGTIGIYSATTLTMTGNDFFAGENGFNKTSYPDNNWLTAYPSSGKTILLRPNRYETSRAMLTILNWDSSATVKVKVTPTFSNNDTVRVYDGQNYLGGVIQSPVVTSDSITITMLDRNATVPTAISVPSGHDPFQHQDRRFGVFILSLTGEAQEPPPETPATHRKRHLSKGKKYD